MLCFLKDMLIEFYASQQFILRRNSAKAETGVEKVSAEEYSVEIFKPIARASFLMLRKDS